MLQCRKIHSPAILPSTGTALLLAALLPLTPRIALAAPPATHSPTPQPADAGQVQFEIHADQPGHPISPLIYGINAAAPADLAATGYALQRSGGNRMTAYNWENNASNAGADWHFQNDAYLSRSDAPCAALQDILDRANAGLRPALLTVPIADYVAADKNGGGDVRNSGPDYLATRFKRNAPARGAPFAPLPDTTDAFVYQDEFVNYVQTHWPKATVMYALDNEPDLWASTHAEIRPGTTPAEKKVTYAELVDRNTRFARAIKSVAPRALVAGFVSYGWNGYSTLQSAPDAAANGNFIDYYLAHMKANSDAAGTRLVDFLDLHYYPEATGDTTRNASGNLIRILENSAAPDVVQARLNAPRSLFDDQYVEKSWITQWATRGRPIRLIPLMQEKIAAHWPGTKLAFTEWDMGAHEDITGAIATADTLGIFGTQAVDMACFWGNGSFISGAFQIYRNYDAAGATFGDLSLPATTTNRDTSSIYASRFTAQPTRLVLVAINKKPATQIATIHIVAPAQFSAAKVWTLTKESYEPATKSTSPRPAPPLTITPPTPFAYNMPAYSVSVIVPR